MKIYEFPTPNVETQEFLAGMREGWPLASELEFTAIGGNAAHETAGRNASDFDSPVRAINADANSKTGTREQNLKPKKIASTETKLDVMFDRRFGGSNSTMLTPASADGFLNELYIRGREFGYMLQEMSIEGDAGADPLAFNGIRNLVDASQKFELDDGSTDGYVLPVSGSDADVGAQRAYWEQFEVASTLIPGVNIMDPRKTPYLLLNNVLAVRLRSVAKATQNWYSIDDPDFPGQKLEFIIMNGQAVRLVVAGVYRDGTVPATPHLLPFNETVGAAVNASSMFLIVPGEDEQFTGYTTDGIIVNDPERVKSQLVAQADGDLILSTQNVRSLAQIEGTRLV